MPRFPQINPFERVDDIPVEIPTRLRLPVNRTEQMRQFIRQEMSRAAEQNGAETFEEADDIEPDDGEDYPLSPYEMADLEPPVLPGPVTLPAKQGEAAGLPADDPPASSEVKHVSIPKVSDDGTK